MRTISALVLFGIGVYLLQIPSAAPAAPIETVTLPAVVEPFVEPVVVADEPVCVNGQCSLPQAVKKVTQSVLVQPVKQVTRSVKSRPRLFGRLFRRTSCGG